MAGVLTTNPEHSSVVSIIPDKAQLCKALFAVWLRTKSRCYECGDLHKNSDLRDDKSYLQSGHPICKRCWQFYDTCGSDSNPAYKAPPWPELEIDVSGAKPQKLRGFLYLKTTGETIGTVEDYRPDIRAGYVMLAGQTHDAEFGWLDPDTDVRNIETYEDRSKGSQASKFFKFCKTMMK